MAHLCTDSPFGPVTVFEDGGVLVAVEFGRVPDAAAARHRLLDEACAQLAAYFDGRLSAFDLPLAPAATAFQARVRDAMRAIPYGATSTYGAVAAALDTAARAVGQACRANPLPIIVPCHRILGADGAVGGYTFGDGEPTKRYLLALERRSG